LAYLPEGWWLRFLQPLSGLLFAIDGFLSWRYYQLTNNVFFKMLAISLFIHAGITLESVLPVLNPLSMSGQLSVFQVVQMLHTLLQLTGSLLFAILLVYAIINYNGHEHPLKREFLMAFIVFIILYTAWRIGMLIWAAALPYTIDYVFMFISSVLLTVIYFDGIRGFENYKGYRQPVAEMAGGGNGIKNHLVLILDFSLAFFLLGVWYSTDHVLQLCNNIYYHKHTYLVVNRLGCLRKGVSRWYLFLDYFCLKVVQKVYSALCLNCAEAEKCHNEN